MNYVALEKLHQLIDGYRRVFRVAGEELLLLVENGRPYLLKNRCPHLGASLARASLTPEGIRCPGHGMVFSLETGCAQSGPECSDRLEFVPLAYEGNTLGILLDEANSR